MQQRGPQNLIFTAFSHLIMASGVGEEEIKVDSSANFLRYMFYILLSFYVMPTRLMACGLREL